MKRVLALAMPFLLTGCLGGGSNPVAPSLSSSPSPSSSPSTSSAPAPANISQTLQLNGGTSTGLSISATATTTSSALTINSVSDPNPATVTVTPSGTITDVTLSATNARLTGNTSQWASPTDTVVINSNSMEACAGGNCDTTLRGLNLYTTDTTIPAGPVFQYLTWGDWYEDSDFSGTVNSVVGFLVVGQPTLPANIPVSGTATYTGLTMGIIADSATSHVGDFHANFSATADFSARTLTVSTSGMTVMMNHTPVPRPDLDYFGTLSYSPGSNQFSGTVNTTSSGGTGTATGQFFGPAAEEIGGVVKINGGTFGAIGTFSGKR